MDQPNFEIEAKQASTNPSELGKKITQASGQYLHNHSEGILRLIANWIISFLKFLQFSIIQIINQVLGK